MSSHGGMSLVGSFYVFVKFRWGKAEFVVWPVEVFIKCEMFFQDNCAPSNCQGSGDGFLCVV